MFDKDKDFLYIVLDLCDASLTDCVKRGKFVPEYLSEISKAKFKISIVKDILTGLAYLHNMDVIHRDLKPQNVLIKRSVSAEYGILAVITDFGLSLEIREDQTHVTAAEAGSKGWKPKEVIGKGKKHFKKSMDIFAFGCVAQFALSKYLGPSSRFLHPFGSEVSRERNIRLVQRVAYLTNPGAPVESEVDLLGDILVNMCINNDPTLRPEAGELLNHPLFWSHTTKLHFVEKVFDENRDKINSGPVNSLEENWRKYKPKSVESKIPEAWGYHFFCRKLAGKSKPTTNSIFNGILRVTKNIQQHRREAVKRYTQPHKHANSDAETKLEEVLGDCSDEAIGQYFFSRIPSFIPIVYLSLYLHARESRVLQHYFKNADMTEAVAEGKMKAAWSALDKVLLDVRSPRAKVPSASFNRNRSKSNSKAN